MNEDTVTVDTDESAVPFEQVADPYALRKEDLLEGILDLCGNIEAVGEEAIEIAIDITLAEVASHLSMLDLDAASEAVTEIREN